MNCFCSISLMADRTRTIHLQRFNTNWTRSSSALLVWLLDVRSFEGHSTTEVGQTPIYGLNMTTIYKLQNICLHKDNRMQDGICTVSAWNDLKILDTPYETTTKEFRYFWSSHLLKVNMNCAHQHCCFHNVFVNATNWNWSCFSSILKILNKVLNTYVVM